MPAPATATQTAPVQTRPAISSASTTTPPTTPMKPKATRSGRPHKRYPYSPSSSSLSSSLSPTTTLTASLSSFTATGSSKHFSTETFSPAPNLAASPSSDSCCSSTSASSHSEASPVSAHASDSAPSSSVKDSLQIPVLTSEALSEDLEHLILQSETIDDELAESAANAALKKVLDFHSATKLPNRPAPMPLSWDDVTIERLLGVGGFCCVTLARIPKLERRLDRVQLLGESASSLGSLTEEGEEDYEDNDNDEEEETETEVEDTFASRQTQRRRPRNSITAITDSPRGKYALKCLNKTSVSSSKRFVRAAQGLAYEATMLSHLSHQNIIQIHGIIDNCDASTYRRPGGYFLVLQCMRRTLDDVLRTWRKRQGSASTASQVPTIHDRLSSIAIGIAKGMSYLHDNNIIFRDLKPHNVGIDYEGNVRIFDFGIAKEMEALGPQDYDDQGKPLRYPIIKGCVGSLRYMAPEVLVQHQASYPSDVYSFAILLWQICVLKKPYGTKMHTAAHFRQYVGQMNVRPTPVPSNLDGSVRRLILSGWNEQPYKRPSFPQVISQLERIVDRGEAGQHHSAALPLSASYSDDDQSLPLSPSSRKKLLSKLIPSFLKNGKSKRRTAPSS